MTRKSSTSLLMIVALVSIVIIVCHAQSSPLLTRHVHEVTLNGQAPLLGRLPAAQPLRLVLVLPLRDQAGLDQFLNELYDPSSPSYRQFLTVEEFTERFGPSEKDYEAAIRFAEAHGLKVVGTSRNRVNLDVAGPVSSVEQAFHITLGVYQHPTENRIFYAPDREPTVDLPFQLWHIAGLDNYSIPRPALLRRDENKQPRPNATTGSGPSASFLGSDMRAAYYAGTALTGSGQSLGLAEYAGTDLADLNTYYTNVHQTNNVPITLLSVDGTSTSCVYEAPTWCDDTEQTVDMTQALGMAPGLSSLVMYIGSTDAAVLNAMATAEPLNNQLSESWTWPSPDPNTDNPYFQQFQTHGQSFFQASGDYAEWTTTLLDDGRVYPADDPYIISVGGTDLTTSSAGGPWASETAWSDSGGGISPSPDNFPIPNWQTATATDCDYCSHVYRNGPDVAANANQSFYVCADQTTCTANYLGGTSFAAPMWAGYLALVNQQAAYNGEKPLGFINPTIYTIGLGDLTSGYENDFHDISGGSNGYPAVAGYDLVTGWGSPNGPGLINALTAFSARKTAGAGTNVVCSSPNASYTNWTSPGDVSSTTAFASAQVANTPKETISSQCLYATGFQFSIPANETITGIQVSFTAYVSAGSIPISFKTQLLSNGSPTGYDLYAAYEVSNTSPVTYTSGPTLWGTTWAPANVSATNFGVSIQAAPEVGNQGGTAYVDDVQITVFYVQVP